MSIYKVNAGLPLSDRITILNDQILELAGQLRQAKFDKLELDAVYEDFLHSGSVRKYLRDQSLGNTLATYSGWSHIKAEQGYSIWKYTPTSYKYDVTNSIYFDGKELINKREAASETATIFDNVFTLTGNSGSSYVDVTANAGTEAAPTFSILPYDHSYIYLGNASTFNGIKFEFDTRASGVTLKLEYWNDSVWVTLTSITHGLVDNTNNFTGDGAITWNTISGWAQNSVNSTTKYWIRISTTTDPVTAPSVYYIIPSTSVVGLLALSSTAIFNEEWAFCSYLNSIYVTIRNDGAPLYEGDYYITSASIAQNLQNFFVYNHAFTGDFVNINYS